MAKNQVDAVMATRIALDTTPVQRELNNLKRSVGVISRAWQNQYSALQEAGQGYEAATAKVEGMSHAIENQQKYVDELKQKQADLVKTAANQQQEESDLRDKIRETEAAMRKEAESASKSTDTYKSLRRELAGYKRDLRDVQNVGSHLMTNTRTLSNAQSKLSGMTSALKKAQTEQSHYRSGLTQLQEAQRSAAEVANTHIERLKAEGKSFSANRAQIEEYRRSITNLRAQYEAQKSELSELNSSYDKNADEVRKQRLEIEKTRTALANAKNSLNSLRSSNMQAPLESVRQLHSVLSRLRLPSNLRPSFSILQRSEDTAKAKAEELHQKLLNIGTGVNAKIKGVFSGTFLGTMAGGAALSGLGRITAGLGAATQAGLKFNEAQQTMNASWLTLTGNAQKGQEMVDMTNQLAISAQNSTEMVNNLNQRFYAVTNRADETRALSHAVLTLQDAFHVSDAAIDNFSTQWSQMVGNGKASAQDMLSIQNVFPRFREELLAYERQVTHNKNLTMAEMNQLMSKGQISSQAMNHVLISMGEEYKNATDNFTNTIEGMRRTVKAMMPRLVGDMTEPIVNAENPIYKAVSDWVSDPGTEEKFKELGTKLGNVMNSITSTLGGSADENEIENRLDGLIDHISYEMDKLAQFIQKNAAVIRASLGLINTVFGTTFQVVSSAVSVAIQLINSLLEASGRATMSTQGTANAINNVAAFVRTLGQTISQVLHEIGDTIQSHPQQVQAALGAIRSMFSGAIEVAQAAFNVVGTLLSAFDQALFGASSAASQVTNAFDGVSGIVTSVSNTITNALNRIASAIQQHPQVVSTAMSAISTIFQNLMGIAEALVQDILKIFAAFNEGSNSTKGSAQTFQNGISGIATVATNVANAVKDVMNSITGFITSHASQISSLVSSVWSVVQIGAQVAVQLFKDILGTIGNIIGTGSNSKKTLKAMSDGLKAISQNKNDIKKIADILATMWVVDKVASFAVGVANVINAVKGIKDAVKGVGLAIDAVMDANPIGLTIVAIGAVITAFAELYTQSKGFRNMVNQMWAAVKDVFSKIGSGISNWWSRFKKQFQGNMKDTDKLFSGLSKTAQNVVNAIGNFFTKTLPNKLKAAKKTIASAISTVGSTFNNLKNKAKDGINAAGNFVRQNLPKTIKAGRSAVKREIDAIGKLFTGLKNGVKNVIDAIGDFFTKTLPNKIKDGIKNIKDAVTDVKDAMKGASPSGKTKKYANGTGTEEDQVALVNDAMSNNFREMMIYKGNIIPFPNKRNVLAYVPKGASIVNGDVAKDYADKKKLNHFASGTGMQSGDEADLVNGIDDDGSKANAAARSAFLRQLNLEYEKQLRKLQQELAKLKQQLEKAQETLRTALERAAKAFKNAMDKANYRLKKSLSDATYAFTHTRDKAKQQYDRKMPRLQRSLAAAVKSKDAGRISDAQERIKEAKEDLAEKIQDATHTRNEKITDARHTFGDSSKNASDTRSEAIASAQKAYQETSNSVNSQIRAAQESIAQLQVWKDDNLRQFDQAAAEYAHGGIATQASIFGEAGPEAAIPLDSMQSGNAWQVLREVVNFFAGGGDSGSGAAGGAQGLAGGGSKTDQLLQKVISLLTLQLQKQDQANSLNSQQIQAVKGINGYDKDKALQDTSTGLMSAFRSALIN